MTVIKSQCITEMFEHKVLKGTLQVSSGPHQKQTKISTHTSVQQTATGELVGYA